MADPSSPDRSSRNARVRKPQLFGVDEYPYSSLMRNHSSASLAGSLRRMSYSAVSEDENDDARSVRSLWRPESPEDRRRYHADERRVSQILADPQMRSVMLLGKENSKYQWRKYWKPEAELRSMKKPM